MTSTSLSRRAFLLGAAATPLMAGRPWGKDFWETKPFSEWSDEEVDRMLTDSPWAKSMSVNFELSDPRRGRKT